MARRPRDGRHASSPKIRASCVQAAASEEESPLEDWTSLEPIEVSKKTANIGVYIHVYQVIYIYNTSK